jgi:uroporphyrin-3 C-methyltransferase
MANKSKTETASDDAITDAVFPEEDFMTAMTDAGSSSPRLPTVLGFTAVLIAGLALAGFFYLLLAANGDPREDDGTDAYLTTLSAAIEKTEASLLTMQNTLSRLADDSGTVNAEMITLDRRIDSRLRVLDAVPERVRRLERSFSALQGISTGVQDTWLLAETEYYMQIANAQLQLAGNPHLATLALKLADERLLQLADPALTEVRRALSDELRALEFIEKPDIEGATMTLASLAGVVDLLPLRQEVQISSSVTDQPDVELAGVDRALASLKGAIGDVVTIRRTDESVRPLIAPEAIYFLRANLALQFQTARLALLRGEQSVFQQSLSDADAWIEEYYDLQSTSVLSALQSIREIRDSSFVSAVPDISESLRLLRQHAAFTEAAEALPVYTNEAADARPLETVEPGEPDNVLEVESGVEPPQ